jgi:hypothetical protein
LSFAESQLAGPVEAVITTPAKKVVYAVSRDEFVIVGCVSNAANSDAMLGNPLPNPSVEIGSNTAES